MRQATGSAQRAGHQNRRETANSESCCTSRTKTFAAAASVRPENCQA